MAEVLLICKLFSATLFWVTKRPPKADYTKDHGGHKEKEEGRLIVKWQFI